MANDQTHPKGPNVPKETWLRVRAGYEAGEGSCRQLAERFGLNPVAVSTRCKRESWNNRTKATMAKFGQTLDRKLDQLAEATAQTMAEKAQNLIERSITESHEWLDHIQRAKALLAVNDFEGLRTLINAWKIPIQCTSDLLGLGRGETTRTTINLTMLAEDARHARILNEPGQVAIFDVPCEIEPSGRS